MTPCDSKYSVEVVSSPGLTPLPPSKEMLPKILLSLETYFVPQGLRLHSLSPRTLQCQEAHTQVTLPKQPPER